MTDRFDHLSRSESGLHYVREKRGGVARVLTESEMQDFNDPPPCPECSEQFGCDHFNCVGEPLFAEAEIEANVPSEWVTFANADGFYWLARNFADAAAAAKLKVGDTVTLRRFD